MEHSTVLYDETKDTLKTEYLALFHGMLIISKIDEFLTASQLLNVGMVIKSEDLLINKEKLLERPLINVL